MAEKSVDGLMFMNHTLLYVLIKVTDKGLSVHCPG